MGSEERSKDRGGPLGRRGSEEEEEDGLGGPGSPSCAKCSAIPSH